MKVLLVSEGTHENSGALTAFIDRLTNQEHDYVNHPANDKSIHASHGVSGIGPRLVKRVRCFCELAVQRKCEALIYLIDGDREQRREQAMRDAQSDQSILFPRAVGVAVETFDAWILADEAALSNVLGKVVQRQPDPESNKDAKADCSALLQKHCSLLRQRDFYTEVCRIIDLNRLEK